MQLRDLVQRPKTSCSTLPRLANGKTLSRPANEKACPAVWGTRICSFLVVGVDSSEQIIDSAMRKLVRQFGEQTRACFFFSWRWCRLQ